MGVVALMAFLEAIENMAFPTWVRQSPSIFAYTTILTLHAVGLSTLVGLNTVISLRILGVAKGIPLTMLVTLKRAMYAGFWINLTSGLILLWASLTHMVVNRYFYAKLIFIVLAMINLSFLCNRVLTHPGLRENQLPEGAVRAAWLSLLLWTAAIICGRVTAYPGILGNLIGI